MLEEFNRNLKTIISSDWTESEFGLSKHKADYKRQLHTIIALDFLNRVHYRGETDTIHDSDVGYISESKGKSYKFINGKMKIKEDKNKKTKKLVVTVVAGFPPFSKMVIDYLLGRYVFFNDKLYDVNDKQAKSIDDFTLQNLYGFKHDSQFIFDILKGIDKIIHVRPARELKPYQMAGTDFIIDLQKHTLTRTTIGEQYSYFKYYDVDFSTAKESQKLTEEFLDYVIANEDSLHNAKLQTYYMAQVASGLRSKTNFFVSKSNVRTGKGLRHIALSGLFNKIDVELDNLLGRGFDAMNAWALFSGGEMALATEQGDIMGEKMERVLKIIATEKTHVARSVGGNQGLVYLTSVLCIDTNRNVALSEEMNGRKVLIQYKDRPENETDLEREAIFRPYWEAFTELDKSPKIDGVIGFLLNSLEYFNKQDQKFDWRNVEVFNDVDLDDFQIFLINRLSEVDFVERDVLVSAMYDKVYGRNNNKASEAFETIGVKSHRKETTGRRKIPGYIVKNIQRFRSFAGAQMKEDKQQTLSMFENTTPPTNAHH